MNHAYFIEIVLVFGAALVWAFWELWNARPDKREKGSAERPRHPEGQ